MVTFKNPQARAGTKYGSRFKLIKDFSLENIIIHIIFLQSSCVSLILDISEPDVQNSNKLLKHQ
jgi:hypothetical protein